MNCTALQPTGKPPARRRFVRCELHGCTVSVGLPESCPMREARPVEMIAALERRGFDRIDNHEPGGPDDLARAACCFYCISENLRNSTVRRLRSLMGVSQHG